MRKILSVTVLCCLAYFAQAQQLHFTSQYLSMPSMYNPAASGLSGRNFMGVSYRSMWSSFPGNPKTSIVYGDMQLKKLNAGMSTYLFKDETGAISRTGLQFGYSYQIKSKNGKHQFGFGLGLRGMQYAVNQSKIAEALGTADPVLTGSKSKFSVDADAGVYWTNGKMTAGIAANQLIGSQLKLANVDNATLDGRLYRQYNVIFSYKIETGENINIIPNTLIRLSENGPAEYDFGAKFDFQDKMWWSMNMRANQFWSLQAGLKIRQRVRATYAYDIYTNPVGVFVNGSGAHEVGIQFDMK